jgi:hypothetical protein
VVMLWSCCSAGVILANASFLQDPDTVESTQQVRREGFWVCSLWLGKSPVAMTLYIATANLLLSQ